MHSFCCASSVRTQAAPTHCSPHMSPPASSNPPSRIHQPAAISPSSSARNGYSHGQNWQVNINDIASDGVSGILYKWVNYGKGWRRRWFVLQDGVLSYYKIHGPDRIVVNQETEKGSRVIGDESMKRIMNHSRSSRNGSSSLESKKRKAFGEVHLKVSTIRESRSDDKKFSIFTGAKTLHLKAENREDRVKWMEAFQVVKDMFPRMSNTELMAPVENLAVSTEKLRQRLLQEGVSEAAIQESEQIMRSEFALLQKELTLLKQKHLFLVDTLRQLETEKVDLENTVVDESRQLQVFGASSTSRQDKYSESTSESEDENERADPAEDTDEEDNTFFDTKDVLSSSSFINNMPEFRMNSSDDEHEEALDPVIKSTGSNFPYIKRRKKLPDPVEKEKGVSLWSMLKDNIGKDLTKICLPVYFNEPLSSLQKCFEDLEYSYLIDRAYEWGKKGNGLMRILNVAAFAVLGYSSSEGRSCKPFNPLLGETYEAHYPDKGLQFFSEKVSHHPTIVACHCDGTGWKFYGDSNLKSKFWGRSIQLDPVGTLTIKFDDGEIFQWSKVHGTVQDKSGKTVATLFGKWDESMHTVVGDCSKGKSHASSSQAQLLWKRWKPPTLSTRYNLTRFAITLNELTPGLKENLPPTDSRLRPDQRCLENGEYERANEEKQRLEQRQRQARVMQERGWKPCWFTKDEASGGTYRYVGGYWEARQQRDWRSCPDIFGQVVSENASS